MPNTQWLLEQKLGEGGFGEVWLGRHQVMKERRVFKFCFRADRVRSLKREMTLFRLIKERIGDHPNIVALREVYFERFPAGDHTVELDVAPGCAITTGQPVAVAIVPGVTAEVVFLVDCGAARASSGHEPAGGAAPAAGGP